MDKFLLLRKDIEFQLAHLLWFVWKTYKGRKARLLREEEERKAKKKGKGKKIGQLSVEGLPGPKINLQ